MSRFGWHDGPVTVGEQERPVSGLGDAEVGTAEDPGPCAVAVGLEAAGGRAPEGEDGRDLLEGQPSRAVIEGPPDGLGEKVDVGVVAVGEERPFARLKACDDFG